MLCEHFGRCGGCTYLDIPYEDELALKKNALIECLGTHGHLVETLHPSPRLEGYRNKMEFAFGDDGKDGQLALGIRKKRSFYEVATPLNCVLISEDFKRIVNFTLDFFRSSANSEMFFHRKRHTGSLRHLVLRRGEFTGEILVLLSAASTLKASLSEFVEGLLALPLDGKIVGILHAQNDGVADAVKNENITLLHGCDYYNEEICGLKFKVSMFSFFQTNSRGAEVLYKIVQNFAGTGKSALDLYCGTGTIAQIISPNFEQVMGVEIVEEAIQAAEENAFFNNISNCKFHAGDALFVLDAELSFSTESAAADVIVVDPPRDGLHPKALEKIAAFAKTSAPNIVYVACKPKSLARDMPVLIEAGYTPVKIEAVDMFPRTPHMECVCLFTANGNN